MNIESKEKVHPLDEYAAWCIIRTNFEKIEHTFLINDDRKKTCLNEKMVSSIKMDETIFFSCIKFEKTINRSNLNNLQRVQLI